MKIFRFVFFFSITLTLTVLLDNPQGSIPALGKFLSPNHGFWQNAEKDIISTPDDFEVSGLNQPVRISFDQQLIPHIFAQNDEDLFFAQGYVTAFHRLWQMEFQLLATGGRLSELFGEQALEFDRTQRRKGLTYGASRGLEEVRKDPESLALIEAYTKGVNAYIDQLSYKDLPIEYKLLDYEPEPWTTFKCVLLLKEMADQLSRGDKDLQYTNAYQKWGADIFETLYPERHPNLDPIVPAGTRFDFEPLEITRPDIAFPSVVTENTIENPNPANGSNSFIVNGNKTADGSVLFANEPDLGLNLPSIWYLAHLNSPNYNVIGGTLPGTPSVIIGFNDSTAFGDTNAGWDFVDWYKINFRSADREEYQYDDKWLKTQKIIETIKVKDGETFYDTIIYTHYGPVVYDRNFQANKEKINLAMRWIAHDPSNEFKALRLLNKANNLEDFLNAYQNYTDPPQNVSFASVAGDIAVKISGKFAAKWKDQGKFVMDGSDSRFEWQGYIPEAHEYLSLNPPRNFVSSANQHPGDETYPYYDYGHRYEYFRNRRINDRLKVMTNITEKDMMKLQHDNFNYIAADLLPTILDSLRSDSASMTNAELQMLQELRSWDYFNEPDSKEATVFELLWDNLNALLWDEFEDNAESLALPSRYNTIHILTTNPDFAFVDRQSTPQTESSGDLYMTAFAMALEDLEAWQSENGDDFAWYKFKNTSINHLLPPLRPFSIEGVRIGGNHNIVNAASSRHGPSLRLVVKLGLEGTTGWCVYPGSQTGNPGNPSYAGMIEDWASGNYYAMLFQSNIPADHEQIVHSFTLNPSR